jgi:serine/threonine protein kinase
MTDLDADPWIGQVLHGIELVEFTGTGRTARVYRGVHQALGEPRAVKLILEDLESDPAAKERFLREAKAVRALSHPNIVQILDAGRTPDGYGFLVLEWLEGVGLDRIIAAQAPLPPRRVARILRQLLLALEAAHHAGLVHRDLKPANVMVAEDREANTETIKLIDFGLVRTPGSALTGAGRWVGSPGYLAPELMLGDPATPRSDLYGVGAIGYELLSGKLPFGEAEAGALRGPPPPLPTQTGLEAIVLSLLAGEPSSRPSRASEVAAAIEAINFSRDPDLDTLVAPTPLEDSEEALSTATDPGRKQQPLLRIETRVPPAVANRRRTASLVGLAALLSLVAFFLGGPRRLHRPPRPRRRPPRPTPSRRPKPRAVPWPPILRRPLHQHHPWDAPRPCRSRPPVRAPRNPPKGPFFSCAKRWR